MWQRKDLKKEARKNFKKNYWAMVAVAFVMAFFFTEYVGSNDIVKQYNGNIDNETAKIISEKTYGYDLGRDAYNFVQPKGIKENNIKEKATKGAIANLMTSAMDMEGAIKAILSTVKSFVDNFSILSKMASILGLLINILILVFLRSLLIVGERRFFLENRNYSKTAIGRLGFLIKERKFINPIKGMLARTIFYFFWSFTIVGIFIKWYSYKMVPYILAENPDIHWKDAMKLSIIMMQGNKWKTFVLDMSFWYWHLLKILTGGIFGYFFLNPYTRAAEAELYGVLRKEAILLKMPRYEKLNDHILFIKETEEEHKAVYPGTEKKSIAEKFYRGKSINYERNYGILNLLLLFFTFSMIGWIWEVGLYLFQDGVIIKRGVLHGPWLPIYGFGGIAILLILKKIRNRPALTFIMTILICGTLEYATSWALETFIGQRWWDYSGYFLNLNGRICLEGLLVFAIGGCAFIYLFAPMLDNFFKKIPIKVKLLLIGFLVVAFGVDLIFSHVHPNEGPGITTHANRQEYIEAKNNYHYKTKYIITRLN